jgi:hypothetical protein
MMSTWHSPGDTWLAKLLASNPRSMASNSNASSTDPVALFTKSIVESKEKVAPKGIIDKDIGGDDAITAKGIEVIPSILSRLLAIPTTVLPSEGDTNGVLNIIGDAAQGSLESAENFPHPSLTRVLSSMMYAVNPPLLSFHRGHQAFSTVKLKACPHGEPGTNMNSCPSLMGRDELSGSIFGQHFLLVTSPDSDGTVLPFDRGPAKLLTASMQSLKLLPFDRGPTSRLPILQAILEISFKMTILFRYSSYRNYLLRYMYINFLGNRPQADGE